MTADEYRHWIDAHKAAKELLQTRGTKRTIPESYNTLTINNEERLIRPFKDENTFVLYYIENKELYNVLHETHLAVDHGGRHCTKTVGGEEPEFIDVIENVTVPVGRNVRLACTVRNLGSFKVAWMHFEQSAILTVNTHVITRNPRITVSHDKHRTWYLHINNVQEADRGRYMCQLNTIAAKTQYGYLNVVVPPNIDDSLSSGDVIVREGNNITLTCHSVGFPTPTIKWKRDDGSNIAVNKTYSVSEWEGNQVSMMKISRLDMGAYLCIASNSVPPSVSKRIKVSVDFPPQLRIPHQLVSVPLGFNVTLECFTEAYPTSLNYWTRNDAQMLHDSEKYKIENEIGKPSFKSRMKLTISNISKEDLGTYKCIAKNPRGETDGTIRLYVSEQKTTTAASTIASTTARPKYLDVNVETVGNEIPHEISRNKDKDGKGSSPEANLINKPIQKMRGFKGALSKNDGSNFNNLSSVCVVFKTMLSMTIFLLTLRNS